jgi:hypothetical protein
MRSFTRSWFALAIAACACTPDIADDPPPEAMEFDLGSEPPRAPEPSALIIDQQTGLIDFSLAGLELPEDCSTSPVLSQAGCEFNRYLETLDGYPTRSPVRAPATAELDLDSVTPGDNLVIVGARGQTPVTDVVVGFDAATRSLVLRREASWTPGEFYWVGIRGYANGVRAEGGSTVVGSPTQFLLKQETPLTCGAASPSAIEPSCPALALVSAGRTPAEAAGALFQLETVRQAYLRGGGFELMAALGLPKDELALLFGFPIHTASVLELDPSAGVVPEVTGSGEIRIAVTGSVDPATVAPIAPPVPGSVALIDLTALAQGDFAAAFIEFSASFDETELVVRPAAAPEAGHRYGLFVTDAMTDEAGVPLVAAPVSKFLTLQGELIDDDGESTVSALSDEDAVALEAGRKALAPLFDDVLFTAATGIDRNNVVYCFAFELGESR